MRIEEEKVNYSPLRSEGNNGVKSPRLVKGASGSGSGSEKKMEEEKPKFSLILTKKEIKEDFTTMPCHRPPLSPKETAKKCSEAIGSKSFPNS
ncbi:hypothetical protein C1H46_032315 [Malus baccata]|uniref:Uncharacterized protein n=1 Tax=Malus baccata TaxID=106549 RepID=A0A540L6Q6_MALBA|nr:hypothetical protein C1H46_032315 [Malus baccata]